MHYGYPQLQKLNESEGKNKKNSVCIDSDLANN